MKEYTEQEIQAWLDQKCSAVPGFKLCYEEAVGKLMATLESDPEAMGSVHVDPDSSFVLISYSTPSEEKQFVFLSWGPEHPTE